MNNANILLMDLMLFKSFHDSQKLYYFLNEPPKIIEFR